MTVARTQTIVQLTDDLIADLDTESKRRGTSRSALIREAVVAYLAEGRESIITEQIVDGYRRFPPATPDEWGDAEAVGAMSAVETMQRLDAEEGAAGQDPW